MVQDSLQIVSQIAEAIYDKKGINILALDVRGLSSLADYIIIAEGNVDRHLMAIAGAIEEKMLKEGRRALHIEGKKNGDWIVMDFSDVVVHLFTPSLREKYSLEELWRDAEIVDIESKI